MQERINDQNTIIDSKGEIERKTSRPVDRPLQTVSPFESVKESLQVENGNFTRIVNPLIEELIKMPFKGCELATAMFVIRKTYGYQRKQDAISLTQFQQGLKRCRKTINKTLQKLEESNIIKVDRKGFINIYEINKYFDKWRLVDTGKLVDARTQLVDTDLPKLVDTGRHTKERKKDTKETTKAPALEENIGKTVNEIIDLFKEVNPSHELLFRQKPQRKAVEEMLKKWGREKLEATIRFLPEIITKPYAPRITTPCQLQRDIGKLVAYYKQENFKNNKNKIYGL